jgi:hypothetical protein
MKQGGEGLRDLERARALGSGRFAVNSLAMISIAAVRGFDQICAGSVEEGGETFRQAMQLADSRTDLSTPVRTEIRLRIASRSPTPSRSGSPTVNKKGRESRKSLRASRCRSRGVAMGVR